jgi:hypothetical protein
MAEECSPRLSKNAGEQLVVCETFRFGRTTKDGGYILDLIDLDE